MKTAVKIILLNKKNQVLLQLRDQKHSHAGSWALFGGHIQDAESIEEAIIREIQEELDYHLTDYHFLKETLVEDFGKVYWYFGTVDAQLSELHLQEGDDMQFFSYDELFNISIAPESKKILFEFFASRKT